MDLIFWKVYNEHDVIIKKNYLHEYFVLQIFGFYIEYEVLYIFTILPWYFALNGLLHCQTNFIFIFSTKNISIVALLKLMLINDVSQNRLASRNQQRWKF